jgi:hypothetical protein
VRAILLGASSLGSAHMFGLVSEKQHFAQLSATEDSSLKSEEKLS